MYIYNTLIHLVIAPNISIFIALFQPIQVVSTGNGKAILAHPTGQLLRQIRPIAQPATIQLQSPNSVNPLPNLRPNVSHVPLINSSNIRVRLPDTPTPQNLLQQGTTVIPQFSRGASISATMAGTVLKPSAANVSSSSGQIQQSSSYPTMVTIQGHQVILNPQGGIPPTANQVLPTSSGTGTLKGMAASSSVPAMTITRASYPINTSSTTIVQPNNPVLSQQKIVQIRPHQISSGGNIVINPSSNVFRLPNTSGVTPAGATVIVDSSGPSGQATQLPQHVLQVYCQSFALN